LSRRPHTATHPDTHETTVDARGLACPLPVVRLAEALRACSPGGRVHLLGTDAALLDDLRAFCEATGHRLLSLETRDGMVEAWVEVAPVADRRVGLTRG
jgi:tRNA 2-thiouridine synthesizing protein A